MPHSPNECRTITLVRFGSYRVDTCSCGAVHVAAGPVTVPLADGAFLQFVTILAEGVEQLEASREPQLSVVAEEMRC